MQADTQQTSLKAGQVKVALSKASIIEEYEEKISVNMKPFENLVQNFY